MTSCGLLTLGAIVVAFGVIPEIFLICLDHLIAKDHAADSAGDHR